MDLKEIKWKNVDWSNVVKDSGQKWDLMKALMNFHILLIVGKFVNIWGNISF